MLGKFRSTLLNSNAHVRTLQYCLGGAFVVIVYLMVIYNDAREEQIFRVPPDLRQGTLMRANYVPPPLVYSFTYYIFQQLHNWPEGGDKNFGKRIYSLQGFLTPGFRKKLVKEMEEKSKKGELRNRVRRVQEIYERGYEDARVLIENKDSWIVWLDLDVVETVFAKPVKEVNVQYALRIVRYDVDPEANPWGLAIADYASLPTKLSDEEIQNAFARRM